MSNHRQHQLCEQILVDALRAEDPVLAVYTAANQKDVSVELRQALQCIDPDGLRMTALLVARLRFERLLQGSTLASAWFESDPERFTRAFRAYHEQVPLRAFFPQQEARAFARWYKQNQ